MKKIILSMLLLLALVCFYAMSTTAKGQGITLPQAIDQPSVIPTGTPALCRVETGIDTGKVNFRTCAGTSCAVQSILSNGDVLTVLNRGAWLQVRTAKNQIGFVNSNYCK